MPGVGWLVNGAVAGYLILGTLIKKLIRNRFSSWLFLVILILVVWFVLDRIRFVVWVNLSPLGLMAVILGAAVGFYLLIDHAINRTR